MNLRDAESLGFSSVRALAVALDGSLYALDGKTGQVWVFDSEGRCLRRIGRAGAA